MATQSLGWTKFRRRFTRWIFITSRETISPLFDRAAVLQFIAFPIFLWLLFLARGGERMNEELAMQSAAYQALALAVPFFFMWNALSSVVMVAAEERAEGKWFGRTFIYHQPIQILLDRVSSDDNGRLKEFSTLPSEPGGSVELKIGFDGFEQQRITIMTGVEKSHLSELPPEGLRSHGGITLTWANGGRLYYRTEAETPNPSIVRIFLLSWTI